MNFESPSAHPSELFRKNTEQLPDEDVARLLRVRENLLVAIKTLPQLPADAKDSHVL